MTRRSHAMAPSVGGRALVLTAYLLSTLLTTGRGDFVSDEEALRSALLTNYTVEVRPDLQTNISMLGTLANLNSLDIAAQRMSTIFVPEFIWTDRRLTWNPASYGGLTHLTIKRDKIWIPMVVVENAVNDLSAVGHAADSADTLQLQHTGVVSWFPPMELSTTCVMSISHYPFDTQQCSIVFVAWGHPISELHITPMRMDTTTLYRINGEFDLMSTKVYHVDLPVPGDAYRRCNFDVIYRRKWQFYSQNMLMPIVLNSVLMNAVFLLPLGASDKMGYSLTILLSYTVFLTWVTGNLPPVSTDTSILQVYLAMILCMGSLATLLSIWLSRLYHRAADTPLDPFYRRLADKLLVPFSRLGRCEQRTERKDDLPERPRGVVKVVPYDQLDTGKREEGEGRVEREEGGGRKKKEEGGGREQTEESKDREKREEEVDRKCKDKAAVSWQEFAVLLNDFLFWAFGLTLLLITTVIMTLLYGNY